MAVLCPSCGAEPESAVAGVACSACGATLIAVEPKKDELIGTIVDGRFEVLSRLGQGGMGTVYRARQRSIGREVALKVIDRAAESDVAAVKRFFREAKLASQLSHPNTVSIIEFGQNGDGRLYLAMELVPGQTLLDLVRGGPLPLWRIIRIGVQLCDALEAAHALAIVHRDLKLDNVMVIDGSRDHVKVLDFGLARSLADPQSRATLTGVVAGTPRYLAPEVVLHAVEPAPAQDMYALGVILGEIAVGHELWKAATFDGLLALKLEAKPNLAGADPKLRALIEELVQPEPSGRPGPSAVRAELLALEERRTPASGVPAALDPARALAPTVPPLAITPTPTPGAGAIVLVDSEVALPAPRPATAPSPSPMPSQVHDSQVVALDEVDNTAVSPPPVMAPPGIAMTEELRSRDMLAPSPPPAHAEPPEPQLDAEWRAEKDAKRAKVEADAAAELRAKLAARALSRKTRRMQLGFGLFFAAIAISAAYFAGTRDKYPKSAGGSASGSGAGEVGDNTVTSEQPGLGSAKHTIAIHVRGDADAVKIDGVSVGKPPLTVDHPKTGKVVHVSGTFGGRTTTQDVVADRDRDVELVAP